MKLRSLLKRTWMRLLWATGLLALAKYWIHRNGGVALSFHRILPSPLLRQTCSQSGIVVSETTFDALLSYVKSRYSVFDLASGRLPQHSQKLPIAITFDDGWEDNASRAFPIAARHSLPFTIFICPGLMNQTMPFWPERVVALVRSANTTKDGTERLMRQLESAGYAQWASIFEDPDSSAADRLIECLKSLPRDKRDLLLQCLFESGFSIDPLSSIDSTMSWAQARQLESQGVTFGSHTQNHEILTRINAASVAEELRLSQEGVTQRLSKPCVLFSYPNGDASPEVREAVARTGFALAFINSPGVWRHNGDPLLIPRINLCESKLVGHSGTFSPLSFEYAVFWRAFVNFSRA